MIETKGNTDNQRVRKNVKNFIHFPRIYKNETHLPLRYRDDYAVE